MFYKQLYFFICCHHEHLCYTMISYLAMCFRSVVYSLSKILQFMVSFVKSDVNSLVGWLY